MPAARAAYPPACAATSDPCETGWAVAPVSAGDDAARPLWPARPIRAGSVGTASPPRWMGTMSGYGAAGAPPVLSGICRAPSRWLVPFGRTALRDERVPVPRRLASITLDNLDDLPYKCRKCVLWALD